MKNPTCREVFTRKSIKRRRLPKKGTWTFCQFKEGDFSRKSGDVIMRGAVDIPMHAMLYVYVYFLNNFFLFFIN